MGKETALLADNPFANYVSRPEIADAIYLENPVADALEAISRAVDATRKSSLPRIIPILGDAGFGKTHFFHQLSQEGKNGGFSRQFPKATHLVYVSPPTDPNRTFSHLYFSIIRSQGIDILNQVAERINDKYQGKIEDAFLDNAGPTALVIEAFFALQDPSRRKIALRWLTGMRAKELELDETLIASEGLAFEATILISKFVEKPILIFIDEMEALYLSHGDTAERKFLEGLKRLFNEGKNFIFILAALTSLYDKAMDLSSAAVLQRIDPPVFLKRFKVPDIREYSQQALFNMWKRHGQLARSSEIWPLTDGDLEAAYAYSHGNPREALKWLKFRLEEKKLEILREVAENHKLTKSNVDKARKIIDEVRDDFDNLSLGVFSKGSGAFILLAREEQKYLFAIPPTPKDEQEPFFENLQKTGSEGNYKRVFCFHEDRLSIKNVKIVSIQDQDKSARQISKLLRKELKKK
ncbi:MAG: hypothetical protein ACXACI_03410 [Candidatus Hodarchaeales archaeon]|jgi:hypothetical protein